MKFSIIQMDIVPGDPEANRIKVKELIQKEVEENNPDTIILPEMWTTAYTLPELDEYADVDGEPTIPFIKWLARQHQVNIVAGSIANKKEGGIYNSAYVIDRNGEEVYNYDKVHLVPMLKEEKFLAGGQKPAEVFELDGLKMGLIICYDLRFPELIRSLALEGAQVLIIVAEWPLARRDHWRTLQMARAIENQMYICSSNRIGSYDDVDFAGTSMIINPWGEVLAEGSVEKEESLSLELDLERVKSVRKEVPIFTSRVPHLYKKEK